MSRAERFEDEKRRLVQSCFSKTDASGQLAESYITHIRIQEDSAYPSTPPPPDASPEGKKPRLIIIAVRSTGRVRMHKARENTNGSFSIGKTWNLEELSAIETFSGNPAPPQSEKEQQHREWAGQVGFTVTISKPYYWQAMTSKEKDFFIASAVKIYRKYTKGQVPELRGFDEQKRAEMLGLPPNATPQQHPAPALPASLTPGQRSADSGQFAPSQPPFRPHDQSREGSRYRQSPGPPPSTRDPLRPESAASRQPSGSPAPSRLKPGPASGPRPFASQEQMRSPSREAFSRNDYARPGTSPGPGQGRTPPPGSQGLPLPAPNAPYAQSQRSGSPSSSIASSRDLGARNERLQAQSPARQRNYQHSVDSVSVSEDGRQTDSPQANGNQTGADLFQATRQRWMATSPQQPQNRSATPTSAPQLPPIETMQTARGDATRTPIEQQAHTATSESSAGIDLTDAAAVGALTSFWGPEPTPAAAPPPADAREPSSPPTPERSKKRPPMSPERKGSEASVDLRPPPLRSPTKVPDEVSRHAAVQSRSAQPTPKTEEAPDVKPLVVQNKRQSRETPTLEMPGAFMATPPAVTPSETPAEEIKEPEAPKPEPEPQKKEARREEESEFRPGLGPMIKKDAVRNRFAKVANAAKMANAFKPRPGGAAEKILKMKAEREAAEANGKPLEPDGITGVVPAPRRQEVPTEKQPPTGLGLAGVQDPATPKVEVSSPSSTAKALDSPSIMDSSKHHQAVELSDEQATPRQQDHLQTPDQQDPDQQADKAAFGQKGPRKPQAKVKRRSLQQERNLAALGIDKSLLEGKGLDFEATLAEFGWGDPSLAPRRLEELEADLRREQARLEAGSSLSFDDPQRAEKEAQVAALLNKTIEECDELDGLLTIYNVELSSLKPDIEFIEAQSQGLQVQSSNQKVLRKELQQLVETTSLDRRVLDPLRHGELDEWDSLKQVEESLVKLYQAMIKIDPSLRSTAGGRPKSNRSGLSEEGGVELSRMKALREKREAYQRESAQFCQRLMQHLDYAFTSVFSDGRSRIMRPADASGSGLRRLDKTGFTQIRSGLWPYGPEILFVKELNPPAWGTLLRLYYTKAQPLYADAFKENLSGWKRAARGPTPDEAELLFTAADRHEDAMLGGSGVVGLSGAARKLTVKRSQTLAKTLRSASGGNKSPTENRALVAGQMMSSEAFGGAMDEMAPLISQEQNFVVDLFHASSLEQMDFLDAINMAHPSQRFGTNLIPAKPLDPDREMAKRVTGVMDEIFRFFTQEMGTLLDWAVANDPIQGVGVMACLSKHTFFLQETSQEFLQQLLDTLTGRLQNLWTKFVEEQVRAIEDTKVRIKKRKGVIGFMKVFPPFSVAVENVFATVAKDDYDMHADSIADVRKLVDDAYARINKAMFDSLKVIAKESPAMASQHLKPGDDPDDKEMLNYHILLIENMNHYIEEVDDGGREGGVLAEWKARALGERLDAMDTYVASVIRRPLGSLLVSLTSIHQSPPSLTMFHRTSSTPSTPSCKPTPTTRPPSPTGPPPRAKPPKTYSPPNPTPTKVSAKESSICVAASRSTSRTATKRPFLRNLSLWWRSSARGLMSGRMIGWRGLSGMCIRRRNWRSHWRLGFRGGILGVRFGRNLQGGAEGGGGPTRWEGDFLYNDLAC
jgi:exocyst complex component 1